MKIFLILIIINSFQLAAQEKNYFYQIKDFDQNYSQNTIISRFLHSVGFRYYWATEGLTEKDLSYRLPNDSRSSYETLLHIYDLSKMILNTALNSPIERNDSKGMEFKEIRENTLNNLKKASDIFKKTDNFQELRIIFLRDSKTTEFPFWNQLNGPIEDAVWHCGQIVAFRRASGNPISKKISVFTGKVNED